MLYELVEEARHRLRSEGFDVWEHPDPGAYSTKEKYAQAASPVNDNRVLVVGYGHMGDGNLHLNVCTLGDYKHNQKLHDVLEPWLWEQTKWRGGSISAEHGIGSEKPTAMKYSKGDEAISLMRSLKKTLDPNGILNPYKVLPPV